MPSLTDLYPSSPSSFHEVQRPRQWWVWTLGLGVAALAWANFLCQIIGGQPLGADPAPDWLVWVFWALFGVTAPLLGLTCHLTIKVQDDGLCVTYFPFLRRHFTYADIATCKAITYQALKIYGGWGIRVNMDGSWAYSVSGDQGVQLVFHDGRRLLIGSQQADELTRAIEAKKDERSASKLIR